MPVADAGDVVPTVVEVALSPQAVEAMVKDVAEVTKVGTPLVRRVLELSGGDANALVDEVLDLKSTLTVSRGKGCSSGDGGVVPTVAPPEDGHPRGCQRALIPT